MSSESFADLGVSRPVLGALAERGITEPVQLRQRRLQPSDRTIVEIVRERVRRRFLELLAPDELTDMAGVVEDMREELDSTDFAATRLGRE
jgi:hypothetical protein